MAGQGAEQGTSDDPRDSRSSKSGKSRIARAEEPADVCLYPPLAGNERAGREGCRTVETTKSTLRRRRANAYRTQRRSQLLRRWPPYGHDAPPGCAAEHCWHGRPSEAQPPGGIASEQPGNHLRSRVVVQFTEQQRPETAGSRSQPPGRGRGVGYIVTDRHASNPEGEGFEHVGQHIRVWAPLTCFRKLGEVLGSRGILHSLLAALETSGDHGGSASPPSAASSPPTNKSRLAASTIDERSRGSNSKANDKGRDRSRADGNSEPST